jgi:predicted metal-dependent hydrolase
MRRHPHGNRYEAGGNFVRDHGCTLHHQRERPGPESFRQGSGRIGHRRHQTLNLVDLSDVNDQWISGWTTLRVEHTADCHGIEGVRTQAVDRFGREGDESTGAESLGGWRQRSAIGSVWIHPNDFGHEASVVEGAFCAGDPCDDRVVDRPRQIPFSFDAPVAATTPTADLPSAPSVNGRPATSHSLEPLYFVRHRRARRYLLRVEPDGRLRVTIPRGGSKREAEAFAARNTGWVAKQRESVRERPSIDTADRHVVRERAAIELPARLRELADVHGITGLTRVTVRNQRTRWGSCGRDGHICLNWRLVLMPPEVRDYVIIHELVHLRRMDHSPAYWRLVAAACPHYATARAWLRTHGRGLR